MLILEDKRQKLFICSDFIPLTRENMSFLSHFQPTDLCKLSVHANLCIFSVCSPLPASLFFSRRALQSIALASQRDGVPEVSVGPLICASALSSRPPSLRVPPLSRPVLHNHLFYRFFFFPLSLALSKCLKGLIMCIDNPYKLLF